MARPTPSPAAFLRLRVVTNEHSIEELAGVDVADRGSLSTLPLIIVEDDLYIRRAACRILHSRFTITSYEDAETALAAIDQGAIFDALLCDLHLAGMSGEDMHDALERRSASFGHFASELGSRVMSKPFSSTELVRVLLSASSPRRSILPNVAPKAGPHVLE